MPRQEMAKNRIEIHSHAERENLFIELFDRSFHTVKTILVFVTWKHPYQHFLFTESPYCIRRRLNPYRYPDKTHQKHMQTPFITIHDCQHVYVL